MTENKSGAEAMPEHLQLVAARYAQLIELETLAIRTGHGRRVQDPDCEICVQLWTLRQKAKSEHRLAINHLIIRELSR